MTFINDHHINFDQDFNDDYDGVCINDIHIIEQFYS